MEKVSGITAEAAFSFYREKGPEIDWSKTVLHICLYSNGRVTRARNTHSCSERLCCIDIPQYYTRAGSRLLFCYDNGCVNIMNPKTLLNEKLHRPGIKHNGYNRTAVLKRIFVCNKTDWLAIYCNAGNQHSCIRLFPLAKRTVHKSMCAAGNQFTGEDTPYRWHILPAQLTDILGITSARTILRSSPLFCLLTEIFELLENEGSHVLSPKLQD